MKVAVITGAAQERGKPPRPTIFGFAKSKVVLAGAVIFFMLFLVFQEVLNRKMVMYQEALSLARASSEVNAVLGTSWKPGWHSQCAGEWQKNSGHEECNISLRGNRGRGHLYVAGVKKNGKWFIHDLYFMQNGSGHTIEVVRH